MKWWVYVIVAIGVMFILFVVMMRNLPDLSLVSTDELTDNYSEALTTIGETAYSITEVVRVGGYSPITAIEELSKLAGDVNRIEQKIIANNHRFDSFQLSRLELDIKLARMDIVANIREVESIASTGS